MNIANLLSETRSHRPAGHPPALAGRTALGEGFGGRGGVHLSEASRFGTNATSIASVVIARSDATKQPGAA